MKTLFLFGFVKIMGSNSFECQSRDNAIRIQATNAGTVCTVCQAFEYGMDEGWDFLR